MDSGSARYSVTFLGVLSGPTQKQWTRVKAERIHSHDPVAPAASEVCLNLLGLLLIHEAGSEVLPTVGELQR